MNRLLALVLLLVAVACAQVDKDKGGQQRTCPAEEPFEQLARRRQPVGLPVCSVDGSHRDAQAEAEILSFEEWKAQQLALQADGSGTNDSTPAPVSTTVPESPAAAAPEEQQPIEAPVEASQPPPSPSPSPAPSLKDRYNYASTDCSARVQSSHRQARSADSILSHKKDRYMLSPCSAPDQHVVVELCDDIRIDTVQLANFEFFSGVFKDFKVSASSTGEEWVLAGEYTAKNARGVQSFHPQQDLPNFYRYVRIDFLSHYGNEFYCPVSLLRVYGLTQMEKFKQELAEEQHRASPAVTSVPAAASTVEPSSAPPEPTESSSPASNKTGGTSDVALRPSLDVSDLDKCATMTRAPTSISTSPASSPTSVPTTDAAPPTVSSAATVSPSPTSSTTTTPAVIAPTKPSSVAPAPSPKPTVLTTGDSIYRTIMNRLSVLEANSTLIVRFVEQQALTIREALRRMEEDVGRLDSVTKAQQALFARTLGELEKERRTLDEERVVLMRKVAALADEVVLEKRLGIAQLGLLVAVLLFLAVTRGSSAIAPLPMPRSRTSSLFLHRPRPRVVSDPDPRVEPLPNPASFAPKRDFSFERKQPIPFPAESRTPRARSRTPRRPVDLTSPRKPAPAPAPDSPRLRPSESSSPRTREFAIARPRTPTSAVFARLKRSNSHTTSPADVIGSSGGPRSGRRLARTAHLHEVRSPGARSQAPTQSLADTGLFSPSPTPSDAEAEREGESEGDGQEWVTEDEAASASPPVARRDEPWKLDESPLARRRRKTDLQMPVLPMELTGSS